MPDSCCGCPLYDYCELVLLQCLAEDPLFDPDLPFCGAEGVISDE